MRVEPGKKTVLTDMEQDQLWDACLQAGYQIIGSTDFKSFSQLQIDPENFKKVVSPKGFVSYPDIISGIKDICEDLDIQCIPKKEISSRATFEIYKVSTKVQEFIEVQKGATTGYIVFGRFNPPTKGHSKLLEKVNTLAKAEDSVGLLYLSHTINKPADFKKVAKSAASPIDLATLLKNPLNWDQKRAYVDRIYSDRFPRIYLCDDPTVKNLNAVLTHAYSLGIRTAILVCGEDRVEEYERYLTSFQADPNTVDFDDIGVISAGDRDPDSEGVGGVSATKVRLAVAEGDVASFQSYIDTTDADVLAELFVDIETSFDHT